jgi:hypothetical protein
MAAAMGSMQAARIAARPEKKEVRIMAMPLFGSGSIGRSL